MLTPQDIDRKQFSAARLKKGYAEDEVDEFLERLLVDWTSILRKVDRLETELRVARLSAERAADEPNLDSVKSILVHAQQTADGIKATGERDAAEAVASGERKAAALVNEARQEAAQIIGAATIEADTRAAALKEEIEQLNQKIATLSQRESTYRDFLTKAIKTFESEMKRGAQ